MSKARYDRQILAFGETGQKSVAQVHAAIVGVGGLGSHVAQQLAYLGIGQLTLVDADIVEHSNLNRLVGACPPDEGRPKVDVIMEMVTRISPGVTVHSLSADLRTRAALDALRKANLIFGCVDNDGARLILSEFAAAYGKTYIDSASEILLTDDRQVEDFGGRVVVSRPGEFCLLCAGELDPEAAKSDLESELVKGLRRAHGYGLGPRAPAASVVSLNGIIASIAVTEFLVATTGLRSARPKSTYRGMRGVVTVSVNERLPDCFNCGYLAGLGDAADVYRYVAD